MFFVIAIILTNAIVASTIKIEVSIESSKKCGNMVGARGVFKSFFDSVGIFHTDDNNRISSGACVFLSVTENKAAKFSAHYIGVYTEFDHTMNGPILEDSKTGKYHVVLGVTPTNYVSNTVPVHFYYRNTEMNMEKATIASDQMYELQGEGMLIGDMTVRINGRTVINIKDSGSTCYDSERWIPGYGVYHYVNGKWKTLYYFPHYYPQYLV